MEILMFGASWCGPCKLMKAEVLPELKEKGIEVTQIDIDSESGQVAAAENRVRAVPTVVVKLTDGSSKSFVGFKTVKQFEEFLSE